MILIVRFNHRPKSIQTLKSLQTLFSCLININKHLNRVLGLAGLSSKGGVLEGGRVIKVTKTAETVQSICDGDLICSVFLDQVVKNLLYVAKVIYLISPESDTVNPTEEQEEVEDETTVKTEENEEEEEEEETTDKAEGNEGEEEDKEQKDKPPSLLWVMNKLSLLAKREAADTPKEPLKVSVKSVSVFRLDVSK